MDRTPLDIEPDAGTVIFLRQDRGVGIHKARDIATGQRLREILAEPRDLIDLQQIVLQLVNRAYPE